MFNSDLKVLNLIEATQKLIMDKETKLDGFKFRIINAQGSKYQQKILQNIHTKFAFLNIQNLKTLRDFDKYANAVKQDYETDSYDKMASPGYEMGFGQVQQIDTNKFSKTRFEQIERISKNMKYIEISMKQIQDLVYEQGAIGDRIDWNIESAKSNVTKGNKELDDVQKNVRNWAFR